MNQIKAVFWGASGHAKSVAEALGKKPSIEIVGYLDDVNPERHGQFFEGEKILGGQEQLDLLKAQGITACILGFGHCLRRIQVGKILTEKGFALLQVIHPSSVIASNVSLGEGIVVLAGAVIDTGCRIGNYVIVNHGAVISHECDIGAGTHICPGVNIAGRVTIGPGCWIGIGAAVIDKLKIGSHTFIGAGSVVTRDIPSGYMAYGNPAKVIRQIDKNF